jgi:hypothetical protein
MNRTALLMAVGVTVLLAVVLTYSCSVPVVGGFGSTNQSQGTVTSGSHL